MYTLKRNLFIGLVLCAPMLALPVGCSSAGEDAPAVEKDLSAFTERLDLGEGLTVDFVYDEENHMGSVIARGPESQAKRLDQLGDIKGGVVALYKSVRPSEAVPERINSLQNLILKAAKDGATLEVGKELLLKDDSVAPVASLNAPVNKAIIVSPWTDSWCRDRTDESNARQDWYEKIDWCYENVTSAAWITRSTVRQGFAILQMLQGSGTLRSQYKASNSSVWNTFGTYTVPQGNYQWVRNWSTNNIPIDVRYDVMDTAGDLYNVAIQTAETPITTMTGNAAPKADAGNDYYHLYCVCNDGFVGKGEKCLTAPTSIAADGYTQIPTSSNANFYCGVYCGSHGSGAALNFERRTTGAGCSLSPPPIHCEAPGVFCTCGGRC